MNGEKHKRTKFLELTKQMVAYVTNDYCSITKAVQGTANKSERKMSSFFTVPASQRKRKRTDGVTAAVSKKRNTNTSKTARPQKNGLARPQRDESISGSESDDGEGPTETVDAEDDGEDSEADHEDETAAERRLRLAERYLENIREEVDDVGFDAADIDRDLIAERLKEDVVCLKYISYAANPVAYSWPGRDQRTSISAFSFRAIFSACITCPISSRYTSDYRNRNMPSLRVHCIKRYDSH